jgi:hypothetical protein
MRIRTLLADAATIATLALAGAAQAVPAYTFTTAPTAIDSQLSLGFVFTANADLTVNSLAYYDDGGDGFLTAHQVGIYQGDGQAGPGALLATTTLAAGLSGVLGANDFRYQSIDPLHLLAGQTYTIAGLSPNQSGNDPWVYGGPGTFTGFVTDPLVSVGPDSARFTYNPGASLVDPSDHFGDYDIYAVNFDVSSTGGVPEPETWALMLLGFVAAGAALRSARRRPSIA